jgi:DNA mismatch repair protein MutS2
MARKQIDEHSLHVLEFDQVRRILSSFAASSLGERAAAELYPSLDYDWIVNRQVETTEMKMLLEKQVAIPLAGLRDIEPLIESCSRGRTVFEPGELLNISDTLAASGRIKKFLNYF